MGFLTPLVDTAIPGVYPLSYSQEPLAGAEVLHASFGWRSCRQMSYQGPKRPQEHCGGFFAQSFSTMGLFPKIPSPCVMELIYNGDQRSLSCPVSWQDLAFLGQKAFPW